MRNPRGGDLVGGAIEAQIITKKGVSLWKDAWRRLKKNRFAMGGLVVVVLMTLAVILANVLVPYQPDYGQPWIGAQPPGYSHPAALAENRYDVGQPPVIPQDVPRQIVNMLSADGELVFVAHEVESTDYRVTIRKGRVDKIQEVQGAIAVRTLEVKGAGESLVLVDEQGNTSAPMRDVRLDRRKKLPEGFPHARPEERVYVLILRRVKPRTPEPETITISLAGGKVTGIVRGGVKTDALRLDGRYVLETKKNGEPVVLRHWLGTDLAGRDELARTLHGGRISLMVGGVATLVSMIIGVLYGAIAGYLAARKLDVLGTVAFGVSLVGGIVAAALVWGQGPVAGVFAAIVVFACVPWAGSFLRRIELGSWSRRRVSTTGELMMRITDILYALPFMFIVILLMVSFGRDLWILFFALGMIQWIVPARIVRGQVLSLKEKEFIEAAHMCGASHTSIIFRHLIPNTLGIVTVYATLMVPAVILQESFLAFIGLTVESGGRTLDSWGALINQGRQTLASDGGRWWVLVFPSIAMALTLFSLNFLGDGLRDALDPKMKGKS